MSRDNTFDKAMSNCLKHNIKVYPIHRNGKWYVQVDNDGTLKTYDKEIGSGSTLSSKTTKKRKNQKTTEDNWSDAIKKTWIYWSNLIDKNKS